MTSYRGLPVTIEAVQFTGDNWEEMQNFTGYFGEYFKTSVFVKPYSHNKPMLWVAANQEWLTIDVGEWVIRDQLGFYPCKNEVFEKKYILAEDTDEFGNIPILDETAEDARLIGRIRYALVLSRPSSEVDLICENVLKWRDEFRKAWRKENS